MSQVVPALLGTYGICRGLASGMSPVVPKHFWDLAVAIPDNPVLHTTHAHDTVTQHAHGTCMQHDTCTRHMYASH